MFRVLILAVFYFLSVGAEKLCQNATLGTSRSLYYSGITDLIIHGYRYRTLAGISVISCGNLCLSDTRCFSINYSERDKLCELNGATASQSPSASMELGGSYYYRPEKPGFMKQLQLYQTKIQDSRDSASAECQRVGKHLCQPWEIHQAYKAGKYPDIPTAISFWYSVPDKKVLVNATGLTYLPQQLDLNPIITNESYNLADRDGQAEACSDLDAHLCTLAELKEAYIRGYRQPSSQWPYFSVPNRDVQVLGDGCGNSYSGDECYDCIVPNTPRPYSSSQVFCCQVQSEASSSPAMCCPGLVSPRDPIITQEAYAKEDRDGMASACSVLEGHLCTLVELKEAYLQGYRQPFLQTGNCLLLWLYFSEPNRDAKLYEDGCGHNKSDVDECYEGIVANTPRLDPSGRVFCCPVISA